MITRTAQRFCVSFDIAILLSRRDSHIEGCLCDKQTGRNLTAAEIRAELGKLQAQGFEVVPTCDRCDETGHCQGHNYHVHELKTWPEFFGEVWAGRKNAEFRKDDRKFKVGDELELREYDPESDSYTGREIEATITHVARGRFIPEGFAMLSIRVTSKEGGPG